MALQLVGGAFLSSFLNVLFDKLASRQVINFLKGQKLDVRQLEKLEITLNSVNGLLDDAEEKQITKTAVKNWLNRLRDVAYEADDLLDDISYEALRSDLEAGDSETSEAKLKEIPERLEKVLERLEYLAKQKDILGLRERAVEKASSQRVSTTCVVDESGVYGRDADKEAILKLLQRDNANGNELEVIPIVGMGGVGKTTLAQLVFNDNRVEEWFDLRVWVCVSEDYDALRIAKEILNQVSDSVNCDKMNLNQLYIALKEGLTGKKLLLALDDVWNDRYADWDFLQTPLKFGLRGSKIIVTTRNENVASIMRTVPTYHLKKLDDEDCWSLFAKHAFGGGYFDENKKRIGRKIVRKCGGLPLAAKTLGGLLRCERDIAKWKNISKSNLWELRDDTILPALRLSYRYLPSCLKQCFAFCAIFPKGYKFQKYRVIRFWMAEGFLVQLNAEKEMEEVGAEYFDDLVSRSFFQPRSGGIAFTMHDLINDLAKHVCGEFLSRLEGDNACKIAERTRYLSYKKASCDDSKKFEGIYDAQLLRSFVPLLTRSKREIPGEVVHDLICALKCLRVLSLSGYINVVDLPNSIGNLKHLRYLSLRETGIEKLPDIVSTLYNLQTLILKGCDKLIELPRNIGRLIYLRYLNIEGTKLQWMPPQMRNLKNLRKLTYFIIGKQRESSSSISELGELPLLEGRLVVQNLQYVTDSPATLKDIMKHKEHLKELTLKWNGDTDDSLHERSILEKLQPHTNIKMLSIIGYGGTRFADWVGDSSFSNITFLKLEGCTYCSSLPPLGQLASLKDLSISSFDSVVTVGPEFFGSCNMAIEIPFRSLETLTFAKIPRWNEWIVHKEGHKEAFPLLRFLYITDCPNLAKDLPLHLPSLETLVIEGCEQLVPPLL